jgi:hypothetical protein
VRLEGLLKARSVSCPKIVLAPSFVEVRQTEPPLVHSDGDVEDAHQGSFLLLVVLLQLLQLIGRNSIG